MDKVLKILKDNEASFIASSGMALFRVADTTFGCLEGIELFLGLSETQCHLEVLEKRGLVFSRRQGVLKVYYPANVRP